MALSEYVRRGKKLVPPIMAMATPIRETNWQVQRLPEIFWIAFLIGRLGPKAAFEYMCEMTKAVQATLNRSRNETRAVRAYLLSEHVSMTDNERRLILNEHREATWLRAFGPNISDMSAIWPDLPTHYLRRDGANGVVNRVETIGEVKALLAQCADRHDKLALIVQASIVAAELECGHLFIQRDWTYQT